MKSQDKILFLHIPKTAGSSITASSIKINKIIHPIFPEGAWQKIKELSLENYYKIAFVRNPWDRFVSLYYYFYNMSPTHFAYKYDHQTVKNIQRFQNFEDFCLNFADFNGSQAFKKFHFMNQHLWTHHKSKCFLDFLGYFENLNSDLDRLASELNIEIKKIPHLNASVHENYKKYYNDKTMDIVANLYARDISIFNYTF